jgi:hypothetical protein
MPRGKPSRRRYNKSPKAKYKDHKASAKSRNLVFTLTLMQWWAIWHKSGKWSKRGNRKGQYCMSRLRDQGGYSEGNVYIAKVERNMAGSYAKAFGRPHPDDTDPIPF